MDLLDVAQDTIEVVTMPDAMQDHAVAGVSNGTNEFLYVHYHVPCLF